MDVYNDSEDEDQQDAVSFNRKPMKSLEIRVQEARKALNEDPRIIRDLENFCAFVENLQNTDDAYRRRAIISKYYGFEYAS